jgi:putative sigma-54 modulation protein
MDVSITFKHLEHTPALDERIREKSRKLEKYPGRARG